MSYWLGLFLTALMGLSLGLLGGGGSILAVPILVYALGLGAHAAIALSLVLVGSTALLAALFHHRTVPLAWRRALLFAACGAPFSLLGAFASRRLPGPLLLLLFAMIMVVVAVLMFRHRPAPPSQARSNLPLLAASGAGVGFLTGFLGVGGGFLIVPALVLLVAMPIKRAVGTSLLIIAANCGVALVGHWPALDMQWDLVLPLTAVALLGTFFGVLLCQRVSPLRLRQVFAVFVLLIGLAMGLRNLLAL
jgi:uncharacterized membrane protein YfcA